MKDMHCGWVQAGLAVLILVFSIWPTQILSAQLSWWVVVVSAALLLVHAAICKKCCGIMCGESKSAMSSKSSRKRR